MIQLIGTLSVLHRYGFAHRDIKPGNIMFKRNKDNEYEFYIADMGECEALFDKLDPLYEE